MFIRYDGRNVPVEEQRSKGSSRVRQLLHALRPSQPECVYLFGSWARGEADALSDLDVVLIKHTTQPFFERLREARRLVPAALGGVDLLGLYPGRIRRHAPGRERLCRDDR